MSYTLDLPPDTRGQITEFIDSVGQGPARRAVADAILDELNKLSVNPYLGGPVYDGPFEKRRFYPFTLTIGGKPREMQFAYKVLESARRLVISGFDDVP